MNKKVLTLGSLLTLGTILIGGCGASKTVTPSPNIQATQTATNKPLIERIRTDNPKDFATDYLNNYKDLMGLDKSDVTKLLTNPDKYGDIMISEETAKVANLQKIDIKSITVLEQGADYALVGAWYNSTYKDLSGVPTYAIVPLGKKDGKWLLESDFSRYPASDAKYIENDINKYLNYFLASKDGTQYKNDLQTTNDKYKEQLTQIQTTVMSDLKDKTDEIQKHKMIF